MTRDELLALPVSIDVVIAGKALGIGRNKSYEMAKRGDFPLPVLILGDRYRVITADLLRLLGEERPPADTEDRSHPAA